MNQRQPITVWAIAFACMVSFMGIGLVDPILPAISRSLGASSSQTMLLFTSYLFITGIAMFFTSWLAGKIGIKATLISGLILVVIFAAAAGLAPSIGAIIGFRAGWGLGNALFISTALSAIVAAVSGGSAQAIMFYEAALGIGMAVGPLLGGVLGGISWRGPFFGTAALMLIALLAIAILLKGGALPQQPEVKITASLRALGHRTLGSLSTVAVLYNLAFFILLAYSPYPLEAAAHAAGYTSFGAHGLGFVFFGWGVCLAITSVFGAPRLASRFGVYRSLLWSLVILLIIFVLMSVTVSNFWVLTLLVIVAGLVLGTINTTLTSTVMEATDLPRSVASSGYSGMRFIGGAFAPAIAGPFATHFGAAAPYWFAAVMVILSAATLKLVAGQIAHLDQKESYELHEITDEPLKTRFDQPIC